MSKQTFSISWIFALYFPFLMRPHDARSSVSIWRLSFAVFGLHSYPEWLYFVPSLIAFTLQICNWANIHSLIHTLRTHFYLKTETEWGGTRIVSGPMRVNWLSAQVIGGGPDAIEREKAGAYLALTRTRPNPFREHLPENVLLAARGTASKLIYTELWVIWERGCD